MQNYITLISILSKDWSMIYNSDTNSVKSRVERSLSYRGFGIKQDLLSLLVIWHLAFLDRVFSPDSVGTQFVIFGTMCSPKGDIALLPSISVQDAAAK